MIKARKDQSKRASLGLRMLPGLIVSGLAIMVLARFIDFEELKLAFALADFRWLPVVVIPFIGTLLARSKAWQTLLEEKVRFRDTFFALNQGYLLNNILPFRLGELGRALLLGEKTGLSFWRVLSTVIVERIFDLAFASLIIVVALRYVIDAAWAQTASSIALILVALGFAGLFSLARFPQFFINILNRILEPWPKAKTWILDKLDSFMEGLASLRDLGRFARVSFWLALAWFFNLAWYYILLRAFFPVSSWLWAAMVVGAGSLGIAIPSSPGYIGVLEGTLVAVLSLFGVEPALSLAYALVAHAIYFVVTALLGGWAFAQSGRSLGRVFRRLLNQPTAIADD